MKTCCKKQGSLCSLWKLGKAAEGADVMAGWLRNRTGTGNRNRRNRFSRNRKRNRNRRNRFPGIQETKPEPSFPVKLYWNTEEPSLQRNRRNQKPEPLEPFHPRTVTEPNRTGASCNGQNGVEEPEYLRQNQRVCGKKNLEIASFMGIYVDMPRKLKSVDIPARTAPNQRTRPYSPIQSLQSAAGWVAMVIVVFEVRC